MNRLVSKGFGVVVLLLAASVATGCDLIVNNGRCDLKTTGSATFFDSKGCYGVSCGFLPDSGVRVTMPAYDDLRVELYAVGFSVPGPLYIGAEGSTTAGYYDPIAVTVSGREATSGELSYVVKGWKEPDRFGNGAITFDIDGWVEARLNGGRGTITGEVECVYGIPEEATP